MLSYFINIIKMYRGLPKSPRNVKLYIHSLHEKNHIVYYLYLAKIQNEDWLSRMELTNYFLTELNDYNINSLNALIKMYKEEKVQLFNIPIKQAEVCRMVHRNFCR
jgi:hypothetical protein